MIGHNVRNFKTFWNKSKCFWNQQISFTGIFLKLQLRGVHTALPNLSESTGYAQVDALYHDWMTRYHLHKNTESVFLKHYCNYKNIRFIEETLNVSSALKEYIPENFARMWQVCPLEGTSDETLHVATPYPWRHLDELAFVCGKKLTVVAATRRHVDEAIACIYDLKNDFALDMFFKNIVEQAVFKRVSDIHFEATPAGIVVKFRVDGLLKKIESLPEEQLAPLMAKLKLGAQLDIAERRRPQDGNILVHIGQHSVDCRLSIVPSVYGESAVLRLLDKGVVRWQLADLGLETHDYATLIRSIHAPDGLFLVTGPTGAGKTTTLYALLQYLRSTARKIITVEDPVEYQLDGVEQVQTGVSLKPIDALRAALRQTPDTLMIGEIRDPETADIAVNAALAGHKVLSTIHTRCVVDSYERLRYFGVSSGVLAHTVRCLVAQRLVRKLCSHCAQKIPNTSGLLPQIASVYEPAGCEKCAHIGFYGRIGIFELLALTPDRRQNLALATTHDSIVATLKMYAYTTLASDAACKIRRGCVTLKEVASLL